MKNVRYFLAVAAVAVMMGCGQTNATAGSDDIHLFLDDSTVIGTNTCCYKVDVKVKLGVDAASQLINDTLSAFYFNQPGMGLETAMQLWNDELVHDYYDTVAEMKAEGLGTDDYLSFMDWSFEVTGGEEPAPEGIRTFRGSFSQYTGGAHGSYLTFYIHFDAATGRRLTTEEVLGITPAQALPIVQRYFVSCDGETIDEAATNGGYWSASEWPEPQNFCFNEACDTVIFLYNEYEVACYAVGTVKIPVPLTALK